MNGQQFRERIQAFQFTELFNEMGWGHLKEDLPVKAGEETFSLQSVAEKSNFRILVCSTDRIPDYNTRKKLDSQVSKRFKEHLTIFINREKTEQLWQVIIRQPGKPAKLSEVRWSKGQDPEKLYQRAAGLIFTIDEEESITIVDVTQRISANFVQNNEKVTKKFYTEFKTQHTAFLKFIKGITEKVDQEWYASLMLNRLMFCYFIQKKGFLDNNKNYLSDKLKESKARTGQDKFYSFYRTFLLKLFHKGLGAPNHSAKLEVELGKIPYLNGGLFDEHELEKNYDIQIEDKAFEKLFKFFDEWDWHLDSRPEASGKEINPDVIGYIFEKYINDRADMGAYYTKEDITDYISKNCILPYLFDETKRHYKDAFEPGGEIWTMLKNSGDTYIYDAVKKGVNPNDPWGDLPDDVNAGLDPNQKDLVEKRRCWNRPAPEEAALATEIWREVIERRKRYLEVRSKIEKGEITEINDFITFNLNIRQFVQDVVENSTDPEFILHFYKSIAGDDKSRKPISVLDPTCGSGAFLFAALNILEPLYKACIQRMRSFVEEEDNLNQKDKSSFQHKYRFFREVLKQVQNTAVHPNSDYFIYKSIILRNLYGVDIMKEAVEIAKLRLFLQLVATVDADYSKDNLGLEPLPDMDFNIRAGNTLVGFATEADLKKALESEFDFGEDLGKITTECEIVAMTFQRYKEIQLTQGEDYKAFQESKKELNKRLLKLNRDLNQILHKQYVAMKYDKWLETHKPFHWFAEFYEIVSGRGGFDVIIGNPPYLALDKVSYDVARQDFKCGDLYGYVIRRCLLLLAGNSRFSFIVMHNLAFSGNFLDVRRALFSASSAAWFSFYGRIPAGLFSGDVRVRNCVFLIDRTVSASKSHLFTTRLHRWFSESREYLFERLTFAPMQGKEVIPMFSSIVLSKFFSHYRGEKIGQLVSKTSKKRLYFKQSAYNWIAVSHKQAPCFSSKGVKIEQSQVSDFGVTSEEIASLLLLYLNGRMFFSYWLTYGDEFHVTQSDFFGCTAVITNLHQQDKEYLLKLSEDFVNRIDSTIQFKLNAGKKVGTYNTSLLWDLTDRSDQVFLKYLTDNPKDVFEAIQDHVSQTVLTANVQDEESD